ncbi:MAG: type II secretion system secretin GspD [Bradymonadaceae bacterium]
MAADYRRRQETMHSTAIRTLTRSLVAVCALAALPTSAAAQEATTDRPGVLERTSGDESTEGESADSRPGDESGSSRTGKTQGQPSGAEPSAGSTDGSKKSDGSGAGAPEQQQAADGGKVITPDNASPHEKYNLPQNFDPNYEPKEAPEDVKVTIDFRQAKLEEVVKFFSGAMNQNFIIANNIQSNKTITIISPKNVTLDEAYRAFLAALEMNGLTINRMGEFYKIVQSKRAISEPGPTYDEDDNIPNDARMITTIIPVEHADVGKIKEIIGNFTSSAATVLTYQDSLIITENAANIRRIRDLVDRLDKGTAGQRVFVYNVQYAEAKKIAGKLKKLFKKQKQRRNQKGAQTGGVQVKVTQLLADKRTNKLIIVTNKKSFEKIKDMIKMLDVPTKAGGQVHVKFLEYADAETLSSTLSNLVSAAQQGGRGGGEGGRQVAAVLQGKVHITAYKPNNALVVVASPKDYVALERVIETLDKPRKQVYVEAVIMEIGLDTDQTLGLGFNAGLNQDFQGVIPKSAVENDTVSSTQGLAVGQSNFPGLTGLTDAISGTGGAIGLLGPLVNIPGTSISLPAFALLLQATQTDNSVNILSTPSILTMDNKEAKIQVGEQVPVLQGVSAGGGLGGLGALGAGAALGNQGSTTGTAGATGATGATGTRSTTGQTGAGTGLGGGLGAGLGGLGGLGGGLVSPINYQDVGLTLSIKPQINDSRYVRLEVDQQVSDLKGAGGTNLTPTQTKRNVKTTVLVKDQRTVVIGGLMRDSKNKTTEKVPFLGDIPVLGVLFKKTSTITQKKNLVLMLTPYIISDESDLRKIYERKLKERRELVKLFAKRDIEYVKSINYEKKSGLVDRMKAKIDQAVEEKRAREKAREALEEKGPRYRILGESSPDRTGSNGSDSSGKSGSGSESSGGASASDSSDSSGSSTPSSTSK